MIYVEKLKAIIKKRKLLVKIYLFVMRCWKWSWGYFYAKQRQPIEHSNSNAHSIDLSCIDFIREKDLDYLSNANLIERDLLPLLGFNNEVLSLFPKELYPFCGKGLFIWQYQNQFAKYLVQLSKFKIDSYMEIGIRHGSTFVTVVEYLSKFYPIKNAVAVDINDCPSLIKYTEMNTKASFMKADSKSIYFKELINSHPGFNLILIDGDHSEAGCRSDYELIKDKANIITFHDIEVNAAPGVAKIWSELKAMHQGEYFFFEYREQYESLEGERWMGIGLAVKKNILKMSDKTISPEI